MGFISAFVIYRLQIIDLLGWRRRKGIRSVHSLLLNKFYIDWLIEEIVVRRLFFGGITKIMDVFDNYAGNGIGRLAVWVIQFSGSRGRKIQNGQVQTSAAVLIAGGVIIFGVVVIF